MFARRLLSRVGAVVSFVPRRAVIVGNISGVRTLSSIAIATRPRIGVTAIGGGVNRNRLSCGGSGLVSALRRGMFIQTQPSRNPLSMKFLPGRSVLESSSGGGGGDSTRDYRSLSAAKESPLATKLFGIDGVSSVLLGSDYISITITDGTSWLVVKPNVFATVMDFFASNEPVIRDSAQTTTGTASGTGSDANGTAPSPDDSPVVSMIKELIETRIRPSVQDDGGDVAFKGFTPAGIVLLQMQGACVGCASSSITLKNGIENMLMHYVPEVTGVEEWKDSELEAVSDSQLKKLESQLNASATAASATATATATGHVHGPNCNH